MPCMLIQSLFCNIFSLHLCFLAFTKTGSALLTLPLSCFLIEAVMTPFPNPAPHTNLPSSCTFYQFCVGCAQLREPTLVESQQQLTIFC